VVLLPGAGLIIPEGVMPRRVLTGAESVRHAEIDETAEGAPGLRLEQGVIHPRLRAPGILRLGNDIEIAGEDEGLLLGEALRSESFEPLQPGQLVGEFFRADRIAIGQIERGDPEGATLDREDALD